MIVLDELFTLHGFELCSEILSEVELPRANSQRLFRVELSRVELSGMELSGMELSGLE